MKTVILAGGRGTRMGEETDIIPKPMITIGGIPLLYHIMNYFTLFGEKDFIILAGYKKEYIIDYFNNNSPDTWDIQILDTGENTPTGQRLLEAQPLITGDHFMLTYGDSIGDIYIPAVQTRYGIGKITAVHPPGRFGTLTMNGSVITNFNEKKRIESEWVNGGFMCFHTKVFKYIEKDEMLEFDVFPRMAEEGILEAHLHYGHWDCMDTPRDRERLEEIWKTKRCYWREL